MLLLIWNLKYLNRPILQINVTNKLPVTFRFQEFDIERFINIEIIETTMHHA